MLMTQRTCKPRSDKIRDKDIYPFSISSTLPIPCSGGAGSSRVRGLRKHEEQPCPLPDQVPRPGQWEEVELDMEYNSLVV